MLRNVTVSTADLAVELVGDGVNTTLAVPEHGTVMPLEGNARHISYFTNR